MAAGTCGYWTEDLREHEGRGALYTVFIKYILVLELEIC